MEIGLKFQTLKAGNLIGVRYWRSQSETGTNTVKLWNAAGTQLGTKAAASPTNAAWNQVNFDTPIALTANTEYRVSVSINAFVASSHGGAEEIMQDSVLFSPLKASVYSATNNVFPNTAAPDDRYYYIAPVFQPSGQTISVRSHVVNHPVFLENLQQGDWDWLILPGNRAINNEICGYSDRDSVPVGQAIKFKIRSSAAPDQCEIKVYRMGYYSGAGARLKTTATITTTAQSTTPTVDATTGLYQFNWADSYTLNIPSDWVSGLYVARITQVSTNKQSEIYFVVRNDSITSDIIYNVSFDNYRAYDNFAFVQSERRGLYDFRSASARSVKVSKNRPLDCSTYGWTTGERATNYDLPSIRWLERMGYRVNYCVNEDISVGRVNLQNYQTYMDAGHNEYWTKEYRDALEASLTAGKNLIFLGANIGYWQTRYEDADSYGGFRTIVCYKSPNNDGVTPSRSADPVSPTTRFRDTAINRPEWLLLGGGIVGTADLVGFDWVPSNLSDPLFANTGFVAGDKIPGGIGLEWDRSHPTNKPVVKQGTNFRILAVSPATSYNADGDYSPDFGLTDPANFQSEAHTTYYEAPSGGKVFHAGSISLQRALDATETYGDLFGNGVRYSIRTSIKFQRLFYNVLSDMKIWGAYSIDSLAIAAPAPSPSPTPTPAPTPTPTEISLFPNANPTTDTAIPGGLVNADSVENFEYELGTKFSVTAAANLTAIRVWISTSEPKTDRQVRLWDSTTGQVVATAPLTGLATGWNRATLSTPFQLVSNRIYIAAYSCRASYPFRHFALQNDVTNGILSAPASLNNTAGANGTLNTLPSQYPNAGWNAAFYYVDPIVVAA